MTLTLKDVKVDYIDDSTAALTILSGDDAGIQFKFGQVDFGEEEPVLNFEYDIISGTPVDLKAFEDSIAQLLILMIEQSIKENSTVFAGGV